jgi:hypothetical protein
MKNGLIAEIDVSHKLLEQVRSTFQLQSSDQVSDSHIKYFLASSMKNALGNEDVQ